jgi:uncharacterized membrane protein HdeD (DUF308 family)
MSTDAKANVTAGGAQLRQEFQHLKSEWLWLLLYGILLIVCGAVAVVYPALTSLTAMMVLGVVLIIAGIATIVAALWAGKWSGLLVQLLTGILYVMAGIIVSDAPLASAVTMALFASAFFIVVGVFRSVAALVVRFPYWGWSLLNGMVTFLLGVIIFRLYHHFPQSVVWVLGLLIGLEMLFHGWTWIMLSLAIKQIPDEAA